MTHLDDSYLELAYIKLFEEYPYLKDDFPEYLGSIEQFKSYCREGFKDKPWFSEPPPPGSLASLVKMPYDDMAKNLFSSTGCIPHKT
jgi:hypothetical protein